MSKTFVKVTAEHDVDEKTKPLALIWTNGKQYELGWPRRSRPAGWRCDILSGVGEESLGVYAPDTIRENCWIYIDYKLILAPNSSTKLRSHSG